METTIDARRSLSEMIKEESRMTTYTIPACYQGVDEIFNGLEMLK